MQNSSYNYIQHLAPNESQSQQHQSTLRLSTTTAATPPPTQSTTTTVTSPSSSTYIKNTNNTNCSSSITSSSVDTKDSFKNNEPLINLSNIKVESNFYLPPPPPPLPPLSLATSEKQPHTSKHNIKLKHDHYSISKHQESLPSLKRKKHHSSTSTSSSPSSSYSLTSHHHHQHHSHANKMLKSVLSPCIVCSVNSSGGNNTACESCRVFFRRHSTAKKLNKFQPCYCTAIVLCTACRYDKCVKLAGMTLDAVAMAPVHVKQEEAPSFHLHHHHHERNYIRLIAQQIEAKRVVIRTATSEAQIRDHFFEMSQSVLDLLLAKTTTTKTTPQHENDCRLR